MHIIIKHSPSNKELPFEAVFESDLGFIIKSKGFSDAEARRELNFLLKNLNKHLEEIIKDNELKIKQQQYF